MTTYTTTENIKAVYIIYLVNELLNDPEFISDVQALAANYEFFKQHPWSSIKSMIASRPSKPTLQQTRLKAEQYYNALRRLIEKYRLDEEWALEITHKAVKNPQLVNCLPDVLTDSRTKDYSITWHASELLSKNEARKDILRQFEVQWTQYVSELRASGLVSVQKRPETKRHMSWVFMRACKGQSWKQIADNQNTKVDTVRKEVQPIIELLGLKSPRLKGGRPRR
ncbi:MAG: hypothetical protein MUP49_07535 [Dehalococcoidia bacterium]|nr:hypothetical protein [Dehalococcoidia bacterium]